MSLRILMVASGLPHPPRSGAMIRIAHFARHLARRHNLTLLTYGGPGDLNPAEELIAAGMDVALVRPPSRRFKRVTQLASVASNRSHLGGIFHGSSLQLELTSRLSNGALDAVIVEGSLLMRHIFPAGVPLILDEHNIEFEALERSARTESSISRKAFNALEARKFKSEEIEAWGRADLCLFTSDREVKLAHALSADLSAAAVANGVDLEYFKPRRAEPTSGSIVFTGTMGYRPNAEAVEWFVREVLPRIHPRRPAATLTVVGGGVPRSVQRLAGPRVVVTGWVPDVRPYAERAAVMIAPLRIGSGTRLKVLEALAMGKPMVSTTLGCEGLEVTSGEHLAIADDPGHFAAEVVRLMEDPVASAAMGARGRALAERNYSWTVLAGRMEQMIERIVSLHQGQVPAATAAAAPT